MYGKMLELKLLWESTSQKSSGDKISCAKKLDASMMLPSEHAFLNKAWRTKFVAQMLMSSIEASPPNDSPLDFSWELVDGNYQWLWFQGDLWPSWLGIRCECERHDSKYCMLLLLFFDCLFL